MRSYSCLDTSTRRGVNRHRSCTHAVPSFHVVLDAQIIIYLDKLFVRLLCFQTQEKVEHTPFTHCVNYDYAQRCLKQGVDAGYIATPAFRKYALFFHFAIALFFTVLLLRLGIFLGTKFCSMMSRLRCSVFYKK